MGDGEGVAAMASKLLAEQTITAHKRARRKSGNPYMGWLAIIISLRVKHDCSIEEAEKIAVSNRHLRRWVERAINTGNPAHKHALAHMRYNGDRSLIEREGDSFVFRIPPP